MVTIVSTPIPLFVEEVFDPILVDKVVVWLNLSDAYTKALLAKSKIMTKTSRLLTE